MTLRALILRSLRFHWRGHLGVLLGAAVGSAALIGALVVGDSVRGSLRENALQRLGWVDAAMAPTDRFFTQQLADKLKPENPSTTNGQPSARVVALLKLPGTAARQDGQARANLVNVLGVPEDFWQSNTRPDSSGRTALPRSRDLPTGTNQPTDDVSAAQQRRPTNQMTRIPKGTVVLNEALAAQLHARPGDDVVLRVHKPTALSRDVPITPQADASVALRLKVHAIAETERMGNFSLQANQAPPLNAFLNRDDLAAAAGLKGKANIILGAASRPDASLSTRQLLRDFMPGQALSKRDALLYQYLRIPPASLRWALSERGFSTVIAEGWTSGLRQRVSLSDLGVDLRGVTGATGIELGSPRIFLDPPIVAANLDWRTNGTARRPEFRMAANVDQKTGLPAVNPDATNVLPILTYLVNQLRAGTNMAPYSMITAAGAPWTPPSLPEDEIVVNQWLADDLHLKPGDALDLAYFLAESGARLVERTNRFRVHSIVPMAGVHADRTLMPEFPGLSKAESTHEWDAGFPLVHKIRDQDEKYWKDHRGTPKAFVTLAAGQAMWGNRFGNLTAIRFPVPLGEDAGAFHANLEGTLLRNIDPASLGLRFEPVRALALAASEQAQDFGQLFLGFSFFLILAALILMALLFQFGLEQRTTEIGTLLALGFAPARVRRLFLWEGTAVAFVGGALGVLGGIGYAKAMLHGLTTIWREAIGASALRFHVTGGTLAIGLCASVVICAATIWFVLRKQARRPARELLAEGADLDSQTSSAGRRKSTRATWMAGVSGVAAAGLIIAAFAGGQTASPGTFFGAGSLLLVAGLTGVAVLLTALDRSEAGRKLSLFGLGLRGCTRRRTRSLASVALLACGSFLVIAVGANRLDSGRDATKRTSGTGGFALLGESTLPVVRDLNTKEGREFFGLDEDLMKGVSVVPLRVRDGDEASCLNLNRAQKPRLLGVNPLLMPYDAFTFARILPGAEAKASEWSLLSRNSVPDRIPLDTNEVAAFADAASIQWALGKKLGDTLDYTDERGQSFKVRLVGAVANSILQGSLIIDEAEFLKRFPGEAGHRMFLIDVPSKDGATVKKVSSGLSRALQDVGLELTPTTRRLAAFNAVQNTYLNTFQVLGGLGLLLGSAGLGVVVLRNVLERRGELGLLQAVGFRRRTLQWLVLSEHGGLLGLGLGVGMLAALAAILPVLFAPGAEVHYTALLATLAGVLASGLVWTWVATRWALRGELLKALRNG